MEWQEEKALMEKQYREQAQELDRAKRAAIVAKAKRDEAYLRAHEAKMQFKSAQAGLERCKFDAGRYQWLRGIGLRFPGSGERYAHGHAADRVIDQYMKMDSFGPTETEIRVDPTIRRRRERDPLNPVIPAELAKRLLVPA